METRQLFTSESVTSGHPDKVADRISDSVLDAALAQNPQVRAAIETLVTTNRVFVAGEISGADALPVEQIARAAIADIGYTEAGAGFDADSVEITAIVDSQSSDIAQTVERSQEIREEACEDALSMQGAGDQGIMFGYACDDTPELMPMPIAAAHRLARQLEQVRRQQLPQLRPDGKTQVTVEYQGSLAQRLDTVVVSTQHTADFALADLREQVEQLVIHPVLEELANHIRVDNPRLLINPSGRFVQGGPSADTGLTGRKIIVDTYGGFGRHGGGAFSGKDASKVDRSASYALRWVAKNVVGAGIAKQCEIQVAYAIGRAAPVGLWVNTFGTGIVSDDHLLVQLRELVDLRPRAICERLQLDRPVYASTAAYGHFGRGEFTWEQLDLVPELRSALGV